MPPQSPNNGQMLQNQYDFILKDPQQKPTGKLPLPKLPKLAWIILGVSMGLLVFVVIFALVSGNKVSDKTRYVELLQQATEISRVSTSVQDLSKDPLTDSVAATTSTSLDSSINDLTASLAKANIKVSPKILGNTKDPTIDSKLQDAQQSNTLSSVYYSYLTVNLGTYQQAIKSLYDKAPKTFKPSLEQAYASAGVIISSYPVASAQPTTN